MSEVYMVSMRYALYRGFYVRANSQEEAQAFATENLSGYQEFEMQDSEIEVTGCERTEPDPSEPVFDATGDGGEWLYMQLAAESELGINRYAEPMPEPPVDDREYDADDHDRWEYESEQAQEQAMGRALDDTRPETGREREEREREEFMALLVEEEELAGACGPEDYESDMRNQAQFDALDLQKALDVERDDKSTVYHNQVPNGFAFAEWSVNQKGWIAGKFQSSSNGRGLGYSEYTYIGGKREPTVFASREDAERAAQELK